jgi:hypothetical protein
MPPCLVSRLELAPIQLQTICGRPAPTTRQRRLSGILADHLSQINIDVLRPLTGFAATLVRSPFSLAIALSP